MCWLGQAPCGPLATGMAWHMNRCGFSFFADKFGLKIVGKACKTKSKFKYIESLVFLAKVF